MSRGVGGSEDMSKGGRRRPQSLLSVVVSVVVAVAVAVAVGGLSPQAPVENLVLPPLPVAPKAAVEYTGRSSEGGAVTIRRVRRWVWIRVDSAESSDCRTGDGIGRNYFSVSTTADAADRFAHAETFGSTVGVPQRLWGLVPSRELVPKRVTIHIAGRLLSDGRVAGRVERRDVAEQEGEIVLDCERNVTWSARAQG